MPLSAKRPIHPETLSVFGGLSRNAPARTRRGGPGRSSRNMLPCVVIPHRAVWIARSNPRMVPDARGIKHQASPATVPDTRSSCAPGDGKKGLSGRSLGSQGSPAPAHTLTMDVHGGGGATRAPYPEMNPPTTLPFPLKVLDIGRVFP